jgi:hypothetical protein
MEMKSHSFNNMSSGPSALSWNIKMKKYYKTYTPYNKENTNHPTLEDVYETTINSQVVYSLSNHNAKRITDRETC